MSEKPYCADCGYTPVDGDFPYSVTHKGQYPDCTSCVYFNSRNCGRDTGPEKDFFDQTLM